MRTLSEIISSRVNEIYSDDITPLDREEAERCGYLLADIMQWVRNSYPQEYRKRKLSEVVADTKKARMEIAARYKPLLLSHDEIIIDIDLEIP